MRWFGDAFENCFRNEPQIEDAAKLLAGAGRNVVDHDVKLRGEDQHADAREHSLNERRRHGAEYGTQPKEPRNNLNEPADHHNDPRAFRSQISE